MEMVYEHFFYLKQHGNWSFLEAYNLPVGLRKWFVSRLSQHFKEQNEEAKKAQRKRKG
tara:strand:+ start:1441 stop:1614 length:174 start_codon:yes stop_codon:yes gene_type:complete